MRNNKVIKGIVLGSTVLSMLVGHTDITASAKNIERTADMDLYNETGEVLLFIENYTNPDVMGTQMIPRKESQKVEGYVTRNKLNTKNYNLALLDSSNSVTKITVDGKKTYKLKKVAKYSEDTYWYGFGGGHGDRLKSSCKEFDTKKLSQGKHTITAKDKHGHETSIKLWNDTKAPVVKIIKKKNQFYVKATDKGIGVGSVYCGSKVIKKWSERKTSVTVKLSKSACKNYNKALKEYGKYGWVIIKQAIGVGDRAGNSVKKSDMKVCVK